VSKHGVRLCGCMRVQYYHMIAAIEEQCYAVLSNAVLRSTVRTVGVSASPVLIS
jgi:hypothetical protein